MEKISLNDKKVEESKNILESLKNEFSHVCSIFEDETAIHNFNNYYLDFKSKLSGLSGISDIYNSLVYETPSLEVLNLYKKELDQIDCDISTESMDYNIASIKTQINSFKKVVIDDDDSVEMIEDIVSFFNNIEFRTIFNSHALTVLNDMSYEDFSKGYKEMCPTLEQISEFHSGATRLLDLLSSDNGAKECKEILSFLEIKNAAPKSRSSLSENIHTLSKIEFSKISDEIVDFLNRERKYFSNIEDVDTVSSVNKAFNSREMCLDNILSILNLSFQYSKSYYTLLENLEKSR